MRPLRGNTTRQFLYAGAALLVLGSANATATAVTSSDDIVAAPGYRLDHLQLVQSREVEMYIDRQGREVYVDPRTGEIIAIRRPSPMARRGLPELEIRGRIRRAPNSDDIYDIERRRREREVELGRREPPEDRRYLDPEPYEPAYDDDDDYQRERADRHLRRIPRRDAFPEAPVVRRPVEPAEEPTYTRRGSVVRAPLEDPGQDETATLDPNEADAPDDTELRPALPDKGAPAVVWDKASDDVAKIQVLLDRKGVSPGVIDGRMGDNVNKALDTYRQKFGAALRTYDKDSIEAGLAESGGEAFVSYEITPTDVAGQYVASIPEDYGEKAKLDRLGFTSVPEMLAERFHMDEKFLRALNPGIDFNRAGSIIKVVNPGAQQAGEVARIVADKGRKQVRAYDAAGRIVAAYPATIGSQDTPSPTGTHEVSRVAFDPNYTYNPKVNFKQGNNDKVLTIPPGPNGPVGTIWIALDKPTYGVHGTPEPSKIGKTSSHGCVRLTNWDAQELAKMVKPGVPVVFED